MEKSKLNPEELIVTSFEPLDATFAISPLIAPPTDPTAQTRCYICPMQTYDCY